MSNDECHEGSWCPQCGPDVLVDEDGCCTTCGCDAVGDGADIALRMRAKALALVEEAGHYRTVLLAVIGCFGEQDIPTLAKRALKLGNKANPMKSDLMEGVPDAVEWDGGVSNAEVEP